MRSLGDTGSISSSTCFVRVCVRCGAVCFRGRQHVHVHVTCVQAGAGFVAWLGLGLGCGVCGMCGDQTTCVPTLASMGTRGFESWSIIWGKKNCIISPRDACVRAGEGRVRRLGLARGLCGAGARGVCGGCAVRGRGRDVRSSHSTGAWREHALLWYVHH